MTQWQIFLTIILIASIVKFRDYDTLIMMSKKWGCLDEDEQRLSIFKSASTFINLAISWFVSGWIEKAFFTG